jgi:hypothetical protein
MMDSCLKPDPSRICGGAYLLQNAFQHPRAFFKLIGTGVTIEILFNFPFKLFNNFPILSV